MKLKKFNNMLAEEINCEAEFNYDNKLVITSLENPDLEFIMSGDIKLNKVVSVDIIHYYRAFVEPILNEIDDMEEECGNEDDDDEIYDNEADYCIQCHNIQLIDQVINNTLKSEGPITESSASTLLKLAGLKSMLMEQH